MNELQRRDNRRNQYLSSLHYSHPILYEIAYTVKHFFDICHIAKTQGAWNALLYDLDVTGTRFRFRTNDDHIRPKHPHIPMTHGVSDLWEIYK